MGAIGAVSNAISDALGVEAEAQPFPLTESSRPARALPRDQREARRSPKTSSLSSGV
jgi:hypothetical protein